MGKNTSAGKRTSTGAINRTGKSAFKMTTMGTQAPSGSSMNLFGVLERDTHVGTQSLLTTYDHGAHKRRRRMPRR